MQKTLITIGVLILVIDLACPWLVKIPLGRLPGRIDPAALIFAPSTCNLKHVESPVVGET